jgi:hypothetical protein
VFFDRRDVTDEFIDATVVQWLATLDHPGSLGQEPGDRRAGRAGP